MSQALCRRRRPAELTCVNGSATDTYMLVIEWFYRPGTPDYDAGVPADTAGKVISMQAIRIGRQGHGCRARAVAAALLLALGGCAGQPETAATPDLVWPLPPDEPRIRYLGSVSSQSDVEESSRGDQLLSSLLGASTEDNITLRKPYGVHADRDGRLMVTDTGWGKLLVFDFANRDFAVWGTEGQGVLAQPIGVTSDSQGRVFVTDAGQQRVVVFDENGGFLFAAGRTGELGRPTGIAVNEAVGRIYVVDSQNHHIAVFDMAGSMVATIGERGAGPGQFNFPTNLAIDRTGRLYVMDTMNFRVQVLDPDGRPLSAFGQIGDGLGQFARPKGIAVDSEGNIYVADAAFNNFQIFDPAGRLLLFVGGLGQAPGQFWLPAGLYIDGEDRIYVADQYNFRVQLFERVTGEERPAAGIGAEPIPAEVPQD